MQLVRLLLVLLCVVGPADARAAEAAPIIEMRTAWAPVFGHDSPGCDPMDLKACTQACAQASPDLLTGMGGTLAACVTMGDFWADGRAAGKPNPKLAQRSYYTACHLGDVIGCLKEAEAHEAVGAKSGPTTAFAIRASTCLRGPAGRVACLEAAEDIEKHELDANPNVYLVRWHVPACDDRHDQASCDWVTANGGTLAANVRAERGVSQKVPQDTSLFEETHRRVWTQYVYDDAPRSFETLFHTPNLWRCFSVWIPKDAPDETAIAATKAEAFVLYGLPIEDLTTIEVSDQDPTLPDGYQPCEMTDTVEVVTR